MITEKQKANLIPGGFRGHHWKPESVAKRNLRMAGVPRHAYDEEFRKKSSLSHKANPNRYWLGKSRPEVNQWLNNDHARAKMLSSLHRKPNKVEKRLMEILENHAPGEYKFVGDGSVIIGGLCPDFINVNGKKLIIEVFGSYWHNPQLRKLTVHQTVEGRIQAFKSFGFATLILWDYEIKQLLETELVNRVKMLEAM